VEAAPVEAGLVPAVACQSWPRPPSLPRSPRRPALVTSPLLTASYQSPCLGGGSGPARASLRARTAM